MASPTHALRFISGKYKHGADFTLPASGEVIIGRSSDLDMVLREDMVSRRHARIVIDRGQLVLEDLGSTNGSFLNGEKIQRASLTEGDRILIGTSIIKVVAADPNAEPTGRDRQPVPVAQHRTSSTAGSIAELGGIDSLVQLFKANNKTVTLVVRTRSDVGHIYLEDGEVIFATVNDNFEIAPEESFYRIMTWEDGTFNLESHEEMEFPRRIEMGTTGLLLEAARYKDEQQLLATSAPDPDTPVALAVKFGGSLSSLNKAELNVVQLAHEVATYSDVLNGSRAPRMETSKVIDKLVKQGIIQLG